MKKKLKLEPRDSYRGAHVMCECYPEASGKEILELVEHDKKCHELWIRRGQEKTRTFADKINSSPLYYKGRFGFEQRYFYKISNAKVYDDGTLLATVEKVIVFLSDKKEEQDKFSIERKTNELSDLSKYSLSTLEEINQKEWDELNEHLIGVSKFWDTIKIIDKG